MNMQLYVVVTTTNDGERDNFADVILVTDDEALAEETVAKLIKREPIEGIDYNLLAPFDDAASFNRTLNETIRTE